jgi:hypothetical protein
MSSYVHNDPTQNLSVVYPAQAPSAEAEPTDGEVAVEEFLALLAVQIVVLLAETVVRYIIPAVRSGVS